MHTSFFHSSFKSVPFRRGVLDDTQQTAVTELFGDGGSGSHSSADPVAPLMKEPLSHSAAQQPKEWRLYPSVPYYAPLQGMQLVINLAGPEEPPATERTALIY
uniref:Uncharacterized protein TCIL3000_7_5100 n=1 Tax=Trypanosoma congolense (strain IL3000) TaxID=1068625 RepID=G0UQN5_TRYCI|nr:unnamed protein product [Trypanosoma congolense IL3000]